MDRDGSAPEGARCNTLPIPSRTRRSAGGAAASEVAAPTPHYTHMVARAGSELPTSYDTSPIILKDAIRNLKTLVPTAPTTVGDWLIQLTTCVSERTLEALRKPRSLVPTDGETFADYEDMEYSTPEEVAEADIIMFPEWLAWYQHMQHEMYSLLLSKVDWAKEPNLARAIRSFN